MVKVKFPNGQVPKKSRHVRWNWEELEDGSEMARYHFIIVDNKNLKGKMTEILNHAQEESIINHMFDKVRQPVEGKVKDSNFQYFFVSYDTKCTADFLNPKSIFPSVIRDKELFERKVLNMEDYVSRIYE